MPKDIPAELLSKIEANARAEGRTRNEYILLTLGVDIAEMEKTMEQDFDNAQERSNAARSLRLVNSPAQQIAARTNGNAPVKPGSRPRGRPKLHKPENLIL